MNNVTNECPRGDITHDSDDSAFDPPALAQLLCRARDVERRQQFFGWFQTCFGGLLPRAVLVCGSYSRTRRELELDIFNSVVLGRTLTAEFSDLKSELMRTAVLEWLSAGSRALWLDLERIVSSPQLASELQQMGMTHALVHGVSRPQRPSELETFFLFAAPNWQAHSRELACLEMLLPCLHITYLRVLATEQAVGIKPAVASVSASRGALGTLTSRELQVLACVRDGMRNAEIGQALSISALTAKNHVQNILRKLEASSRAHAVAKADALRLPLAPTGAGTSRSSAGDNLVPGKPADDRKR